jgi:hypothetical protein
MALFMYCMGRDVKKGNAEGIKRDAVIAAVKGSVDEVKDHTDGVNAQMIKMAKAAGEKEGHVRATAAGEATAATLAEGQAQGRAQAHEQDNKTDADNK